MSGLQQNRGVDSPAQNPPNMAERQMAENHLAALFGQAQAGDGAILIYSKAPFTTKFFPATDHAQAAAYAFEKSATSDVYVVSNLIAESAVGAIKKRRGRGMESEIQSVIALVCDIDTSSGDHKNSGYPTQSEALQALLLMPLAPSIINFSGPSDGGLHAFWLLDRAVDVSDPARRRRVKEISKGWQGLLKAKLHPSLLDSTYDLVRPLRIPGLKNHKYGVVTRPAQIEDHRYQLHQFAAHLDLTRTQNRQPPQVPDISATERVSRCRRYLERLPDAVSKKGRQNATLRAACECFRFGLKESEALQMMQWFNQTKTEPPLPPERLQHKITAALKAVLDAGQVGSRLEVRLE